MPQPISELEFSAPSRSEKKRSTKKKLLSDVPSLTSSQLTMVIQQLRDISPNCMFFATQPRSQSDTDSASENGDEDTSSVPELLTTLFNPRIRSERDSEKKEIMMKQCGTDIKFMPHDEASRMFSFVACSSYRENYSQYSS